MTDGLEISEAGRYDNVFLRDRMLASYDKHTGDLVVYDPHDDSEDPAFVVDAARGVGDD